MFMIFSVYRFVSLFYGLLVLSLALPDIFLTPMAGYSLFMLKVPLNSSQLTSY